jgi:hypothetical protein
MKKLVSFILGLSIFILISFTISSTYESKNSTAEVEQVSGIYIFVDSKPVKEYEVLGTVKIAVMRSGPEYIWVRDHLIKKIKKNFPEANGAIFDFNVPGSNNCDAIRIK